MGEYYTGTAKNLYTEKASNVMWSDEAPEYSHQSDRSTDSEDFSMSTTTQDMLKDTNFLSGKNSVNNPCYEQVQSAKKAVRFTSV